MKAVLIAAIVATASLTTSITPVEARSLKHTGNDSCPYKLGGVCYSKPGKRTGCGDLETTTIGGETYCKLGPANNPKPVPSVRDRARTLGSGG